MNKLTIEQAANFTPIQCVKYFRPEWSNKECFFFLHQINSFNYSKQALIDLLNERFVLEIKIAGR
jgi:hypothetical protein